MYATRESGNSLITFFDYYIFILINYCILESLSERNLVVVE
ncbi:hypothetical protein T4B_12523 [Trichinella pseudospiralis]|uniref:Uncharacterized protein n=1 Tax=Trichinella pseudospiralis TaxID=6337 RepID=A0A0V1DPS4_TRIPS|nr:hypothetical protein T4A_3099 [Trichinella pseudospiralis]KRY63530.1 hypothetical protein T4A_7358 [Trichinella pseudospiralis]KRY98481.1 hypothetical protein T4B_12523 [Trichinella pseudospiralis]